MFRRPFAAIFCEELMDGLPNRPLPVACAPRPLRGRTNALHMRAGQCTVHDCMTSRPSSFEPQHLACNGRTPQCDSDDKKTLCSPLDKRHNFRTSTARDVGVIVHRRTNGDTAAVMVRKSVDFERLSFGSEKNLGRCRRKLSWHLPCRHASAKCLVVPPAYLRYTLSLWQSALSTTANACRR
jgi:hypothetical protein